MKEKNKEVKEKDIKGQEEVKNKENEKKEQSEPEQVQKIIEHLPPEEQSVLEGLMISSSMTSTSSPIPPQILDKLNEKHIDRILDISDESDKREYTYKTKKEKYTFYYVILGIAVFVFLTVFLAKDKTDLFLDVVKIGAGFLGGLGLGTYKKNKK